MAQKAKPKTPNSAKNKQAPTPDYEIEIKKLKDELDKEKETRNYAVVEKVH
jgi:hypothetical protein